MLKSWPTAARRQRSQNVLIMVFSITIMSLLILTLLRTDLINEWQAQLLKHPESLHDEHHPQSDCRYSGIL